MYSEFAIVGESFSANVRFLDVTEERISSKWNCGFCFRQSIYLYVNPQIFSNIFLSLYFLFIENMLFFLKHTTFFTILQLCFFWQNNIYVFVTYITYYMKFTVSLYKYYFTLLYIKNFETSLNKFSYFV